MDGRAFSKHSATLEPGSDNGRPRALLRKSLLEGGISGGQGTAAPTGPFIFSGSNCESPGSFLALFAPVLARPAPFHLAIPYP